MLNSRLQTSGAALKPLQTPSQKPQEKQPSSARAIEAVPRGTVLGQMTSSGKSVSQTPPSVRPISPVTTTSTSANKPVNLAASLPSRLSHSDATNALSTSPSHSVTLSSASSGAVSSTSDILTPPLARHPWTPSSVSAPSSPSGGGKRVTLLLQQEQQGGVAARLAEKAHMLRESATADLLPRVPTPTAATDTEAGLAFAEEDAHANRRAAVQPTAARKGYAQRYGQMRANLK